MMNYIPKNIEQFLIQNIDSIAQLEILLLLHKEQNTRWDKETIAKRLYIRQADVALLLLPLYMRGFLDNQGGLYIYQPHSEEIKNDIEQLTDLYGKYLIPITNIIHSKQTNRIQQFADAFRIRKD
jgi:hypothetical protein